MAGDPDQPFDDCSDFPGVMDQKKVTPVQRNKHYLRSMIFSHGKKADDTKGTEYRKRGQRTF